jgi:hypothetical protein
MVLLILALQVHQVPSNHGNGSLRPFLLLGNVALFLPRDFHRRRPNPLFCMTDILDQDAELAGPGERDDIKSYPASAQLLPLGDQPVLDANQFAAVEVGPA